MKEEVYYVVDSLGVAHQEIIERPTETISSLFLEGGLGNMVVISVFLIAILITAWKAPRWVKEIGIGALVFSIFTTLLGLRQICDAIQMTPEMPKFSVICGGIKVALLPVYYGLIVYFVSLVIRVIQKPRI